eukprot:120944-Chlamydomonas_euryale.AAC.1
MSLGRDVGKLGARCGLLSCGTSGLIGVEWREWSGWGGWNGVERLEWGWAAGVGLGGWSGVGRLEWGGAAGVGWSGWSGVERLEWRLAAWKTCNSTAVAILPALQFYRRRHARHAGGRLHVSYVHACGGKDAASLAHSCPA